MIKFQSKFNPDLTAAKKAYQNLTDHHPMTGWLTIPPTPPEELSHLKATANHIRQNFPYLVCIGIGGSYLGHKAVIDALGSSTPTKILYAGNSLSAISLQQVISEIGDQDFAVNVISKSGTTTEPAIAFRIFRDRLIQKYGEEEAARHIFVTTDQARGALHDEAVAKNYERFTVPDDIGGRYSVLTPVGLLPIAVAGVNIDDLLAGAKAEAESAARDESPAALQYAAVRQHLAATHPTEVLACSEPTLRYFEYWWEQLFGESEGKHHQGIFPTSLVYTTDLHSLGQYLQDGRRDLFETFLQFEQYHLPPLPIPTASDNSDGLDYLAGQPLTHVNAEAIQATITAHQSGHPGLPVLQVTAPDFSAQSFGALIYFFELACAVSAKLSGVNPFDQPGVEAYKQEMFRRLGKPGYTHLGTR